MQTTTKIFSLCLVLCMWCLLLSSSLLAYIWKKMRTHKRKEKNECFPLMHIIQIHSKRMVEESFCTSTVANSQWAGILFNAKSISLVFFKRYTTYNYPFRYQYGRMISFYSFQKKKNVRISVSFNSIVHYPFCAIFTQYLLRGFHYVYFWSSNYIFCFSLQSYYFTMW